MEINKCFLVSCYALKTEAEYIDIALPEETTMGTSYDMRSVLAEGAPYKQSVSHTGGLVVARSVEEATSLAKERILNIWPESEGWTIHSVNVKEISEANLAEALERLRASASTMLMM